MRILILASKLDSGGAERVATLWANGFVKQGHEVAIATCTKNLWDRTFPLESRIKVFDLGRNSLLRYAYFHTNFSLSCAYKYVVKKFKPDIIIGVLHPYAYYAYKAVGNSIPIINTEHNVFERPSYAPMSEVAKICKFEWNKVFDYITVLTQADKDYIGDKLPKVSVLPNPLSYPIQKTVPNKRKIILATGRFNVWHIKGLDILINAWGKVSNLYPEWMLHIAGTGTHEEVEFIKKLVADNHCGNQTELLGYCSDIIERYKESSIFVLSSRYEGFGMVLTEAMSQGCACIACDYKGRQAEIITRPEEGIICPTDDADALALAIKKMIEDDEYRHTTQRNSLLRAEYYSLDKTMERWNNIFAKLNLGHQNNVKC